MNHCIYCGRLTADPEIKYGSNSKMAIASFTIAVERDYKKEGEPSADFINCVAFGKVAEALEKYMRKGKKILVSGSMQNANYKDKNGVQHYAMKCLVNKWEFADGNNNSNNGEEEETPVKRNPKPSEPQKDYDDFDVPFT